MEGRFVMGLSLSALLVFALIAWLTYWASGKVGPFAAA